MSRPAVLTAVLFSVALSLSLIGCTQAPALSSIQIVPAGVSLTTVGQTVQFKAIATYVRPDHSPTTSDVTSQAAWASSESSVSTISSTGLATAVAGGSTTITASLGGGLGTTTLTVAATATRGLTSIQIIPATQNVSSLGESSQFIAIGTFTTAPMTTDITNQVTWRSSDVTVATINPAGLALANAVGTTTITAIGTSTGGNAITAASTLSVAGGGGGTPLPQLSLYEVGLGKGTVMSSPAGINCVAASAAGCTGDFVFGSSVILTASPSTGSTFGGWSSNCTPDTATTCTVIMNNNEPVGAIFN